MTFFAKLKQRNVFRMAALYGVSGWLLLQVGDVVFNVLGLPDWSLRLLLAILLLGFPIALVFSWVFEITPEGLKKERDIDRNRSVPGHTAKRLDLAVIGLLALALALFGADRLGWLPRAASPVGDQVTASLSERDTQAPVSPASAAPHDNSIAVLPFVNLSSDPEQEYFSDGLAESLLHRLAQIDDLRVAARTSSFHFKNRTGNIPDIGRQLNVANVLEGSVFRAGNTVRVIAKLIKVDDGFQLWSGNYDEQLDDIFGIQDEIATHVAQELKLALLGASKDVEASALPAGEAAISTVRDTDSLAAFEAYLKGREQLAIGSYVSLPKAQEFFEQAVALDPDYELALIALGETWLNMVNTGQVRVAALAEPLLDIGQRIQALNPQSAPALVMLAWVKLNDNNPEQADSLFRRAYEKSPDAAFVGRQYARYLASRGDFRAVTDVLLRALQRDPMAPDIHRTLAFAFSRLFDPENALIHAKRAQALEPKNPNALSMQSMIFSQSGRFADAIQAVVDARRIDPEDYELPAYTALYLLAIGELDAAREEIELAKSMVDDGFLPLVAEAALLRRAGDIDASGELLIGVLERGVRPRGIGVVLSVMLLRDYALVSGRHQPILDLLARTMRIDLTTSDFEGSPWQFFVKLMVAPVIRAGGNGQLADAIAATAMSLPDDNLEALLLAAVARQDVDETLVALDQVLFSHLSWVTMGSPALNFVADDPRFQEKLQRLREHEAAQAALWAAANKALPRT